MSLLSVQHLSKRFQRGGVPAVDDVSFDLEAGSITALLGPSGCGKTTTLRLIAGFERPDDGGISLEGRVLVGVSVDTPPERRGIGFVFQDYALFPHLSVLDNVMFGLSAPGNARNSRLTRVERLNRAEEVLNLVGLTIFRDRLPHQLSGGQQQRVALARALAPHPKLILLDEPFSSLDAGLRASTRLEIRKILTSIGATALLVTHDQEEAMSFSDRLIVMRAGRVEQDGDPEAVYRRPRTAFVASFLGQTNLIAGRAGSGRVATPLGEIVTDTNSTGPVMLSIRPESLSLDAPDSSGGTPGVITTRAFKGHDITYIVDAGGLQLTVQAGSSRALEVGDHVRVRLSGGATVVGSSER